MTNLNYSNDFDKEKGIATVCLTDTDTNISYYGRATCHPDDLDMMSEKTGIYLAEARATLKVLKAERRNIKMRFKEMTNFYNSIKDAKSFKVNGFIESKIMKRIRELYYELKDINEEINNLTENLNTYIDLKNSFYIKVRKMRNKHE